MEHTSSSTVVCIYDITSNLWKLVEGIKFPRTFQRYTCCTTTNGRYILFVGAKDTSHFKESGELYALELDTMILLKSKITMPFREGCQAIVMGDNNVLLAGFMRKYCDGIVLKDIWMMIESYGDAIGDMLYVIRRKLNWSGTNHYKIRVTKVLMLANEYELKPATKCVPDGDDCLLM